MTEHTRPQLEQLALACYRGAFTVTHYSGQVREERVFEYQLRDGTWVWGNTAAFYLEACAQLGREHFPFGYDVVHTILREHGEQLHEAPERFATGAYAGKHNPQEPVEWFTGAPGRQTRPALTSEVAAIRGAKKAAQLSLAARLKGMYAGLRPDGALHFHDAEGTCLTEADVAATLATTPRVIRRVLRDRLLPEHFMRLEPRAA